MVPYFFKQCKLESRSRSKGSLVVRAWANTTVEWQECARPQISKRGSNVPPWESKSNSRGEKSIGWKSIESSRAGMKQGLQVCFERRLVVGETIQVGEGGLRSCELLHFGTLALENKGLEEVCWQKGAAAPRQDGRKLHLLVRRCSGIK